MNRRKALAAASGVAVFVVAGGTAMAANLGLLQVGSDVSPVGQLDVAQASALTQPSVTTTSVTTVPTPPVTDAPATAAEPPADDPAAAPEQPPETEARPMPTTAGGEGHNDDSDRVITPTTMTAPAAPVTTAAPRRTTTTEAHEDGHGSERDD
jgi:hypothetical protein